MKNQRLVEPLHPPKGRNRLKKKLYNSELERLQLELVKLQEWVKREGQRVVVLFEGRDAAGKGGIIKRISGPCSHRVVRVEALTAPTEREKTQWYFQRYVSRLPAAGEIVLLDRSWYNRAGVERVMGFCSDDEYEEFLEGCPGFERLLQRSGIRLLKYWISVSDEEQERRFRDRLEDPARRWKLSPMDLESRSRWVEYSQAKDRMFEYTSTNDSPWWVVEGDDKRRARLNCIAHLISQFEYTELPASTLELEPRELGELYVRPPYSNQRFVPDLYE
jgi:polyphosphate kinase 2